MCFAQITKVDHLPPAAVNARCSVCSSEMTCRRSTAPLVTVRMLAQASCRNASKPLPRLSFRILRLLAAQLVLGRVAVVHVVGRIGEGHVGELALQHPLDIGQHRRVAAQQPVLTQHPQIARLRDRLLRQRRRLVVLGQARPAVARQQPLQLARAEADQPEVEAELREIRQLEPQQRLVPAGVQRQLVVGQHVGALLRLAHVRELDHRHPLQTQLPCRQHPAMTGDDAVRAIDQHRVGPAELPDARRDLRHLGIGVGARIAGIGDQLAQRPPGDLQIVHPQNLTKGHESTCCCGQEFRDSAAERPDTPLLNFAGTHSARPARSLRAVRRRQMTSPRGPSGIGRSSAPAALARGLGVMAGLAQRSPVAPRPRTASGRRDAARHGRPPSPARARPAAWHGTHSGWRARYGGPGPAPAGTVAPARRARALPVQLALHRRRALRPRRTVHGRLRGQRRLRNTKPAAAMPGGLIFTRERSGAAPAPRLRLLAF